MVNKLKHLNLDNIEIVNQSGNGKLNFLNYGLDGSKQYINIRLPWCRSFGIKDIEKMKGVKD